MLVNAMDLKYEVILLLDTQVLYYPAAEIHPDSIPTGIHLYYVSKENSIFHISKNETQADYGIILSKKDFGVSKIMSQMILDSDWKMIKSEIGFCEFFNLVMEKDYYIQKAEDHYFTCIMQEKKRLRKKGIRNTLSLPIMELFAETATDEEWAGLYLQKYGNDAYTYWKENKKCSCNEISRVLKYFFDVKNIEYYIEKYTEESNKCIALVDPILDEETKKIAAYKIFKQNADEDERAGYYLALYGPIAYRKWQEAVGLHSPETERISRILKEICIRRQHCA